MYMSDLRPVCLYACLRLCLPLCLSVCLPSYLSLGVSFVISVWHSNEAHFKPILRNGPVQLVNDSEISLVHCPVDDKPRAFIIGELRLLNRNPFPVHLDSNRDTKDIKCWRYSQAFINQSAVVHSLNNKPSSA